MFITTLTSYNKQLLIINFLNIYIYIFENTVTPHAMKTAPTKCLTYKEGSKIATNLNHP